MSKVHFFHLRFHKFDKLNVVDYNECRVERFEKVIDNTRAVTFAFKNVGEMVFFSTAICNGDQFCRATGRDIAETRLHAADALCWPGTDVPVVGPLESAAFRKVVINLFKEMYGE